MANEKQINSRIQMKHDTANNWAKATGFIPKAGEVIVYDYDENDSFGFQTNTKIGDGVNLLSELPFQSKLNFKIPFEDSRATVGNFIDSIYYDANRTQIFILGDQYSEHYELYISNMYSDNYTIQREGYKSLYLPIEVLYSLSFHSLITLMSPIDGEYSPDVNLFSYQYLDQTNTYRISIKQEIYNKNLPSTTVIMPSHIQGLPITTVDSGSPQIYIGCQTLIMPETLLNIGQNGFWLKECYNLYIPKSVQSIASGGINVPSSHQTQIYCEATEKPSGWAEEWTNASEHQIHWGAEMPSQGKLQDAIKKLQSWFPSLVSNTWYLNETITAPTEPLYLDFKYTDSNGNIVLGASIFESVFGSNVRTLNYDTQHVYGIENVLEPGWINETYRTIEVLNTPSIECLTWLQENALITSSSSHNAGLETKAQTIPDAINELRDNTIPRIIINNDENTTLQAVYDAMNEHGWLDRFVYVDFQGWNNHKYLMRYDYRDYPVFQGQNLITGETLEIPMYNGSFSEITIDDFISKQTSYPILSTSPYQYKEDNQLIYTNLHTVSGAINEIGKFLGRQQLVGYVGTWCLNDVIDVPVDLNETITFTDGTGYPYQRIYYSNFGPPVYGLRYDRSNNSTVNIYALTTQYGFSQGYQNNVSRYITFEDDSTMSDFFKEWLVNNAQLIEDNSENYIISDTPFHTTAQTVVGAINELNAKVPQISITYSELKSLRDNGELIEGQSYRITDYVCTTSQENTAALNNQFDIIVTALDNHTLNETASVTHHEGDTYFADVDLATWEIKYCLDNDTERFAWADEVDGKGIIYYMKDHRNNEFGYDFTNITYKGSEICGYEKFGLDPESYYSTFTYLRLMEYSQWGGTHEVSRNSSLDQTVDGTIYYGYTCDTNPTAWGGPDFYVMDKKITSSSIMYHIIDGVVSQVNYGGSLSIRETLVVSPLEPTIHSNILYKAGLEIFSADYGVTSTLRYQLPCIVFIGDHCNSNKFGYSCSRHTFGNNCNANTFGNSCSANTFSNTCYFNTFGDDCYYDSFGDNCSNNTFGYSCYSNTFGNGCYYNMISTSCYYNTFGDNCYYNIFGVECTHNTFDNECTHNTLGRKCKKNIFSAGCCYNTFSDNCFSNNFGDGCSANILDWQCSNISIIDYTSYTSFENPFRTRRVRNSSGFTYNTYVDGDGITTTYGIAKTGTCKDKNIVIPEFYQDGKVVSIDTVAFANNTTITSVILPQTLTTIKMLAFQGCSNLTKIFIPKSVLNISSSGGGVFSGCHNLTIYCEAESQPDSWPSDWNTTNRPVVWGYSENLSNVYEKVATLNYNSANEGDFLRIVNGIPTWASMPNAEDNSF